MTEHVTSPILRAFEQGERLFPYGNSITFWFLLTRFTSFNYSNYQ
jgi:hypothetical protein